jgi:anti-anti-sigma regulatory factor
VKELKIERVGSRDRFRFTLEGVIDGQGARSLDRLLFECQARGARAVHLDFSRVTSISTLGSNVLARQGRVYEETERKIHVTGLAPEIRAALAEVEAILYESNAQEAPAPAAPAQPKTGAPSASATPSFSTAASAEPAPGSAAQKPGPVVPRAPLEVIPANGAPLRATAGQTLSTGAVPPELASLQSKLKLKIVEFRNLFEITRALNLALDIDEVLNLFSLSVMGQFGVDRLAVFLSDSRREGILLPKQVRGFAHGHFQDFAIPPGPFRTAAAEQSFFRMSDVSDTEGSGETIEALRQSGFEWGVALWVRRDLEGVLFLGGRGGRRGFQEDERDLLTTLAHQGAVAIANARFHRAQEDRNLGLVRGMMSLIESRDPYAKGNTERVVRYVTAVAKMLNYPRESLKSLIYGAVLRDIGMITVSHVILKNPAHLSDDEWALIKQHPTRGAQILEEMNLPKEVIEVVLNHHERWGGEGYPRGIRGTEIPLGARVVSLVDGYVAMTAERPYRRALPAEKARQVIAENWGTPFDPTIVEVFLQVLDKIEKRARPRPGAPVPVSSDLPSARAELDPLSSGAMIPMEGRT